MMNRRILLAVMAAAVAASPAPAFADDEKPVPIPPELLGQLRQGGFNIFFRHGLTPNYKDPIDRESNDPRPADCSHERNLSNEGITQAQSIGEAFRSQEIPVGIVRASPMCRAMDTAWYAFGRYERDFNLKLHGTEPDTDPPEAKIWKNIRNIAKILPLPGTNSILLSHGTVGEVFGAGYLDEGEAVIIKPDGLGNWQLIARVKSDQWQGQ